MKYELAIQIEKRHFKQRLKLREKKWKDYATQEDVLSNFKQMAILQKTLQLDLSKPSQVALWHLLHKIVRIVNLMKSKRKPKCESLTDSFLDASNYLDLAKECYYDERGNKTE